MVEKPCILCDSKSYKIVFKEFGVDIVQCHGCGHIFSAYNAEQDYKGYWGAQVSNSDEIVYDFYWNEAHKAMYEEFCRKFLEGKTGRLLDVGSGLGYFLKIASAYSSWEVFGYEISETAVNYSRNKLGLTNVYCGKVEESKFSPNSFNIITLWDVIEHIPNPNSLLTSLASILAPDGFLFLHTPNVLIQLPKARLKKLLKGMRPGISYLEAKDHLNIYSTKTITLVLRGAGFLNIEFIHVKPIQSVAGSKSRLLRSVKNLWFYSAKFLSRISMGHWNLDNLFIVARKK
jgi:2-polyprenyl-3-methyl-5-hydroxy-6-metoxy-1,4-benzoquinol methylase